MQHLEASKGWNKLVASLRKKKGVKDPERLAAWIMRSKKGGESMTNIPSNLIEQAASGADIRQLIQELHDPYEEGEFQEGLRKVGEMLVKCCRSLDDLRTMIGLPDENAKQLDDATSKCSEAVKAVKVMLHDSMNPPQPESDPDSPDAPKTDLEDDEPSDGAPRQDVHKGECGDPMLGEPQRSQQEKRRRKESSGSKRRHESIIEQVAEGADPYLTVKHLDEQDEYTADDVRHAVHLITSRLKANADKMFDGNQAEKLLLGSDSEMKAIINGDDGPDFWIDVQHALQRKGYDLDTDA